VELQGERLAWKGSLAEGQYLIFWPGEPIRVYGLPLKEPDDTAGACPPISLPAGQYRARFGCASPMTMPVRVRVTLQPPERHKIP
jgi:hypothetical protein